MKTLQIEICLHVFTQNYNRFLDLQRKNCSLNDADLTVLLSEQYFRMISDAIIVIFIDYLGFIHTSDRTQDFWNLCYQNKCRCSFFEKFILLAIRASKLRTIQVLPGTIYRFPSCKTHDEVLVIRCYCRQQLLSKS